MSTELATTPPGDIEKFDQSSLERTREEVDIAKKMGKWILASHSVNMKGRIYVMVTGATALAAGCGYSVREVASERKLIEGCGWVWESTCEVIDRQTGNVIGRGSGIVADDEALWKNRPQFARRAMSSTRAAGRALRLSVGHLFAALGAGVASVTREEMPDE